MHVRTTETTISALFLIVLFFFLCAGRFRSVSNSNLRLNFSIEIVKDKFNALSVFRSDFLEMRLLFFSSLKTRSSVFGRIPRRILIGVSDILKNRFFLRSRKMEKGKTY